MKNEDNRGDVALTSSEQGVSVDVDEAKKAEKQPGFAAQLQAILNVLPAYTWYAAPSGGLTFVNKRTAEYLGVSKDHPLRFGIDIGAQRDDWVRLLHPDDQEEARKYWSNCLRTGEAGEHSYRVRSAQGDYRWFLTRFEPLRASDRTLLLWIGATLDIEELKRTEQALRESGYKLHQIVETVPSLVWSADAAGEPTQLNQRMLDYSGMRFEDFQHGGWEAFLHPDDFPETARILHHAIQTGTSYEAVHRLRRADGEYRWHHARGEPLRDREGRIVQWYSLSVDIDEAKRAEDRLRRSEAYLAASQRLSHTGTWVLDPTTMKYLYWSDEAYRIWAFDPLQGLPSRDAVRQRIHPDDRDREWEKVQEALRRKKDHSGEFRIVLPNGTVKYLTGTWQYLFSTNGELVEVIGTSIDVTERKRAEKELRDRAEALRRSEAWLAQAQRLSHSGNWVYNATTMLYLYWSDESYRIWGFDPLQGLPSRENMWQRIHPDDRDRVWEAVQEALSQKKDCGHEFRIVLPDGTVKYLEAANHHLFSPLGALVEAVCTHVDVTERKRAQDEHEKLRQLESDLAHMNRLSVMGELTASLAHEITQPIATARNNARAALNFLDKQPPDLDEVREALHSVVDDADRAGDIIDRIRDQIKKAPPRKCRFDLNKAINEVIVLARSAVTKNGVSVQTRLTEGLALVQGDRVQLQQVVLNLILNAIEAMSTIEAGPRELLTSTEQTQTGGVLVAVRDSGPGIAPEHLERVFEAFHTTKSSGVGMGLSICRSIIDAHGGRLWAVANEPRGAVFQFTLPSAESKS